MPPQGVPCRLVTGFTAGWDCRRWLFSLGSLWSTLRRCEGRSCQVSQLESRVGSVSCPVGGSHPKILAGSQRQWPVLFGGSIDPPWATTQRGSPCLALRLLCTCLHIQEFSSTVFEVNGMSCAVSTVGFSMDLYMGKHVVLTLGCHFINILLKANFDSFYSFYYIHNCVP